MLGRESRRGWMRIFAAAFLLGATAWAQDGKKDPVIKAGMNWLAANFNVSDGYSYLYGLERAGMLYDTEKIGPYFWYTEGTNFLLDAQNADGSWGAYPPGEWWNSSTWDTCFAVLFLKRATRPLEDVETLGVKPK
jgi:hypothetical protein